MLTRRRLNPHQDVLTLFTLIPSTSASTPFLSSTGGSLDLRRRPLILMLDGFESRISFIKSRRRDSILPHGLLFPVPSRLVTGSVSTESFANSNLPVAVAVPGDATRQSLSFYFLFILPPPPLIFIFVFSLLFTFISSFPTV